MIKVTFIGYCRYHACSNFKTWMLYSEDMKFVLNQRKLYLTGLLMTLEVIILENSWLARIENFPLLLKIISLFSQ